MTSPTNFRTIAIWLMLFLNIQLCRNTDAKPISKEVVKETAVALEESRALQKDGGKSLTKFFNNPEGRFITPNSQSILNFILEAPDEMKKDFCKGYVEALESGQVGGHGNQGYGNGDYGNGGSGNGFQGNGGGYGGGNRPGYNRPSFPNNYRPGFNQNYNRRPGVPGAPQIQFALLRSETGDLRSANRGKKDSSKSIIKFDLVNNDKLDPILMSHYRSLVGNKGISGKSGTSYGQTYTIKLTDYCYEALENL